MTKLQRSIISIIVLLPVIAITYLLTNGASEESVVVETPEQPGKINEMTSVKSDPHSPKTQMQMLIAKLEQQMANNELTIEDTMLLGRSYMMNRDYPKAVTTLEKANQMEPNSLDVLIPLADAIAITQKGQYTGRSYELLQQAISLDPKNPMVLWLLGRGETQLGNNDQAGEYWTQLYNMLKPGSENQIKVGQQLATIGKAPAGMQATTHSTSEAAASQKIIINLSIPADVKAKLKGTTAFIYAKSQSGMPMPIAAKRMPGEQLTAQVIITEADELMPARKLKDIAQIKVGIKISDASNVDQGETLFRTEQALPSSKTVNLEVKF